MSIDNQLWLARVGIFNSNQLHHFTSLKANPTNLDNCFFLLKLSKFLYDHRLLNTIDIFLSLPDFETGT